MNPRQGSPLHLRRSLAVFFAAGALLLGACGEEASTDATDDPTEPGSSSPPAPSDSATTDPTDSAPTESAAASLPSCSQTWVAGEDLPKPYKGCDDNGQEVASDALSCSSGQAIVRFSDRFYAVAGGLIKEAPGAVLDKDKDYRSTIAVCRG